MFMIIKKALCAGLTAFSLYAAQSVTIVGRVTDTSGTSLSGAVVSLEKSGQTSITGALGEFTLSGPAAIDGRAAPSLPQRTWVMVRDGRVYVNLAARSNVSVTTFTLQGAIVSALRQSMETGWHQLALRSPGAGVYFFKVKSGNDECVIKSHSTGRSGTISLAQSFTRTTSGGAGTLTKNAGVFNDVIKVTKPKYLNYREIVTNTDTNGITIKMIACDTPLTDIDGNTYQTVKIGKQIWTTENLRTVTFNDGTPIPHSVPISEWAHLTTPAYCFYENTTNTDSILRFGALYNWYVVNTKKLAPKGWHVPTSAEWDSLQNYQITQKNNWDGTSIDNKIGKSLAAKTDWAANEVEGTLGSNVRNNNHSGFTAVPGGSRYHDVDFKNIGQIGFWWTATAPDESHAYLRVLNTYIESLANSLSLTSCGFSVRLVKD
jgi:uncharacterized protein (TIGR02145 family)